MTSPDNTTAPAGVVTEDDMLRAGDLLLCTGDNFHARRDAIAQALADTRTRAEAAAQAREAQFLVEHKARIAELDRLDAGWKRCQEQGRRKDDRLAELEAELTDLKWAIGKKDKQIADLSKAFDESATRLAELEAERDAALTCMEQWKQTAFTAQKLYSSTEPTP